MSVSHLRFLTRPSAPALTLDLVAAARQDRAVRAEAEVEAAELEVGRLVGGVDLEDAEVLGLGLVLLDELGQVDGGAFGEGAALRHPADALLFERADGLDADVGAGQRLAVEAQQLRYAIEVDAGRERLDHLLRLAGLEAEVGLAALEASARRISRPASCQASSSSRRRRDHELRRRLDERHRGDRRKRHQPLGQLDQAAVVALVDLAQGRGALGEERVGLAAEAAGDTRAQSSR